MVTSRMGITSHTHITRGMGTTGLFVVPGGRGAGWSLVTTRIIGRLNIIATGRPPMATGELGFGVGPPVQRQAGLVATRRKGFEMRKHLATGSIC